MHLFHWCWVTKPHHFCNWVYTTHFCTFLLYCKCSQSFTVNSLLSPPSSLSCLLAKILHLHLCTEKPHTHILSQILRWGNTNSVRSHSCQLYDLNGRLWAKTTSHTVLTKWDYTAENRDRNTVVCVYKSKSVREHMHVCAAPLSSCSEKHRRMTFQCFTWDHVCELPYCTTQKPFRAFTEWE